MEPEEETMNQTPYALCTVNSTTKDTTVMVGLVVDGILDVEKLHDAAKKLVSQWPIVGGHLVPKVLLTVIQQP